MLYVAKMASGYINETPNGVPNSLNGDEVVISGISGIFPKSDGVVDFMNNLYNKVRIYFLR